MLIASSSFGDLHRPSSSSSIATDDFGSFHESCSCTMMPKNYMPEISHCLNTSNQIKCAEIITVNIPCNETGNVIKSETTRILSVEVQTDERNSESTQKDKDYVENIIEASTDSNNFKKHSNDISEHLKININMQTKVGYKAKFKKGSLSFRDFVDVVLIPSRNEFRAACCDLWWTRNDFLQNQQATISEIRQYAAQESLSPRDARRKLYQPTPSDLDPLVVLCEDSSDSDSEFRNYSSPRRQLRQSLSSLMLSNPNIVHSRSNPNLQNQTQQPGFLRKLGSVESFLAKQEERGCLQSMLSPLPGTEGHRGVGPRSCSCSGSDGEESCYLSLYEPLPYLTQRLSPDTGAKVTRDGRRDREGSWDVVSSLSLFGALSLPIFGYCILTYMM
mmetsp:Transcript_4944/g.6812  ORF Transcript_4944/g.6812 Transcript_4944/m.6812 type:complete len:389 (-) Transcript_4944:227-1393(-)